MEAFGNSASNSKTKRSLLYSEDDTSIIQRRWGPSGIHSNNNSMDIDQHPFVRMAMAVAPGRAILTALLHHALSRSNTFSGKRRASRTLSSLARMQNPRSSS
jgi:hypothetical protein